MEDGMEAEFDNNPLEEADIQSHLMDCLNDPLITRRTVLQALAAGGLGMVLASSTDRIPEEVSSLSEGDCLRILHSLDQRNSFAIASMAAIQNGLTAKNIRNKKLNSTEFRIEIPFSGKT